MSNNLFDFNVVKTDPGPSLLEIGEFFLNLLLSVSCLPNGNPELHPLFYVDLVVVVLVHSLKQLSSVQLGEIGLPYQLTKSEESPACLLSSIHLCRSC